MIEPKTRSMQSDVPMGSMTSNIGTLFLRNRERLGEAAAFGERRGGAYRYWSWEELTGDVLRLSAWLRARGLAHGDRVAIVSGNSYERLVVEMAVMGSGLVSVPIFPGYSQAFISELVKFCRVRGLVAEASSGLLAVPSGEEIFRLSLGGEAKGVLSFSDALACFPNHSLETRKMERVLGDVLPHALALIMFTSGTSGFPKGVQLTHHNLMSQQRALELLWRPEPQMRFLCYLPWHHSFGGLFERFFVLHSGGCLAVDDSGGKNTDRLLSNFSEVRPHVYFSVPKVYQEIISRVLSSSEAEKIFFHSELKFVFTAAAPLPLSTSEVFRGKGVPVVEGWGLTETSPCCTLTCLLLDRQPGVVGFPIPGVEIRLGEEDEICVRGPNVMLGYFDNPEATARVLEPGGWFRTGDIGKITPHGLKILSRRDRMFKLSNGEKLFPALIEERIRARCRYVKHAYVFGLGHPKPFALIFPNQELLAAESKGGYPGERCGHPNGCAELSQCLKECLSEINASTGACFERIERLAIVPHEPSIENGEITPSFKLVPKIIEENFRSYMEAIEKNKRSSLPKDALWIEAEKGPFGKG